MPLKKNMNGLLSRYLNTSGIPGYFEIFSVSERHGRMELMYYHNNDCLFLSIPIKISFLYISIDSDHVVAEIERAKKNIPEYVA